MTDIEVQPDRPALRVARRARVLAEMTSADIDILITGREANSRYITGVPRLWLAGSRPFGPSAALVRATEAIHVVSTWDEGVPDDIPREHLHGLTFNPRNILRMLTSLDGAATARTVATDGLTPSLVPLLRSAFPSATLVDGDELLRRVRCIKNVDEVDAIRDAVGVAESALAVTEAALREGVTERQLTGVFMKAMASAGVTTPTTQDVAWITSSARPWTRSTRDAAVRSGDLVAFDAGVIRHGYVGELGRTRLTGEWTGAATTVRRRCGEVWDRLLTSCRPGTPGTALLDAYAASGVPAPPVPVARGLGLGNDLPLVTHELPCTAAEQRLAPGMVFALTAYVWQEGVGGVYGQEPVLVTDTGVELLSTAPFRTSTGS